MKSFFSAITFVLLFTSCAQTQNKNIGVPVGLKQKPADNEAVATLVKVVSGIPRSFFKAWWGVRDAVSGYAGGTSRNPDYELVRAGNTGHAEVVQVYYDPSKISYQTLVAAFFASQDPTELNRQGNDKGTQYRSIAFYRNEREKQMLEDEIKKLADSKKYRDKIVTQVVPFKNFYPAEEYHQEYISLHPENLMYKISPYQII